MRKAHSRPFLWVLAALGIMSGAVAHAQVSLNSLAPNTVVGRLGAGQTGAAQAIPFATLLAQLNGLPSLISGPGSVTSGHVVTWGASNTSLLDSGIASSLVAINAAASPAAGCVQFDGSSHLTSTGANCGNAGATAPGGSNTQIQFNSSGAFAGSAEFLIATNTGTVTITDGGNGAGFGLLVVNSSGSAPQTDVLQVPTIKMANQGGAGAAGLEMYTANGGSTVALVNSGGSASSPTATTSTIGDVQGWGYDGAGYHKSVTMHFAATQTWATSHYGSQILFQTTANNTATPVTAVTIDQDQSVTMGGAATVTGQFTATATNNNIALTTGTGPAHTTLVSDTSRALLHSDNSHNLISDANFGIESNGMMGCLAGQSACTTTAQVNTVLGNLSAVGPGMALGGTNPTLALIGINSNQLNITNAVAFASAGGTFASPTATTANSVAAGQLIIEGFNGSNWGAGAIINIEATETWTGTNNGMRIQFAANGNGTTYGTGSLVMELDSGRGIYNYYDVVLHGASAATAQAGDVALGNTTAVSSNCGSLAGGAACLKFYIGSTAHYIPYF